MHVLAFKCLPYAMWSKRLKSKEQNGKTNAFKIKFIFVMCVLTNEWLGASAYGCYTNKSSLYYKVLRLTLEHGIAVLL